MQACALQSCTLFTQYMFLIFAHILQFLNKLLLFIFYSRKGAGLCFFRARGKNRYALMTALMTADTSSENLTGLSSSGAPDTVHGWGAQWRWGAGWSVITQPVHIVRRPLMHSQPHTRTHTHTRTHAHTHSPTHPHTHTCL